MQIIYKRTFQDYEEWKIEYDVETAATMPAEAGRRVPAYLLVPHQAYERPSPAMVCFHQCGEDCAVGKEAVVGKVPYSSMGNSTFFESEGRISIDRSDQAYGWAEENRDFEGSVHSRIFVPSLVLRKERGVLLASLVPAILGDPLIPLVEAVHGSRKRSTL